MAVCILAWLLPAPPHAGRNAAMDPVFAAAGNLVASGGGEGPADDLHHHLVRKRLRRTELKPETVAFAAQAASLWSDARRDTPASAAIAHAGSDIRPGFTRGPRLPTAPQLRLRPGQAPPVA